MTPDVFKDGSSDNQDPLMQELNKIVSKEAIELQDIYGLLLVERDHYTAKFTQIDEMSLLSVAYQGNLHIINAAVDSWNLRRDNSLLYFVQETWVNRRNQEMQQAYRVVCDALVNLPLFLDSPQTTEIYENAVRRTALVRDDHNEKHPSYWQFDILNNGIRFNQKYVYEGITDSSEVQIIFERYNSGFDKLLKIDPRNV